MTPSGDFAAEKVLEAWFVENVDRPAMASFWALLAHAGGAAPSWFGNYLSFGVAGSSIDVVSVHDQGDASVVTVVELKRGRRTKAQFLSSDAPQALRYAKFLEGAFNRFRHQVRVEAVVLSGPSTPQGITVADVPTLTMAGGHVITPSWLTYAIQTDGTVRFSRII